MKDVTIIIPAYNEEKHIEQAKKTIRKHKPELVERAEEILSERASMLQREEEALRHAQKIHIENEQKQQKERNLCSTSRPFPSKSIPLNLTAQVRLSVNS